MSALGESGLEPNASGGERTRHEDENEEEDGATDYWELIRQLSLQLSRDGAERVHWEVRAHDIARDAIDDPDGFLDWARQNNHLSFTMAEVIAEVQTAPPHDLAHRLLAAILCEVIEQDASIPIDGG